MPETSPPQIPQIARIDWRNRIIGASFSLPLSVCTTLVHTGAMPQNHKTVRQSVTLPPKVAKQVRNMAKTRRVSTTRMLVELVEQGIELHEQREKAFFELAQRFRRATDPDEVQRLGDELGRFLFGR